VTVILFVVDELGDYLEEKLNEAYPPDVVLRSGPMRTSSLPFVRAGIPKTLKR
jgi:hypothetical protein